MGASDDPGGKARMGKAYTLTDLGRTRNGEARWPDQVVDTMSAEGRSLRVDGLGVLLAWAPRTRRATIRMPTGCPKACRALLPIPGADNSVIIALLT
jgi:hypothetical protein